jgi:hypothetical protein
MIPSTDFQSKLAAIKLAMERDEWAKAIHELENIGPIPDKFLPIASNILFFLYISRNQYDKLARLSERFDFSKPKDSVSALLLFRDNALNYPVNLPKNWTLNALEDAIEAHAQTGKLEPTELQLCLYFLSFLNRPRLLQSLHALSVESGALLDDESIEIVVRCLLKNKWFEQARRFLWFNILNDIAFERFSFLVDRAEKSATSVPASKDKFLAFLRYKFGSNFPPTIPDANT